MKQRALHYKYYFLQNINPVIRFLIISDVLIVGAAGLLAPIFAIFVEDFIDGGSVAIAGVAAGILLFTRSAFQIPVATFIDKIRGEKDDFALMLWFSLAGALATVAYVFIDAVWQLYALQFLLGLFAAFTFPSYMAIFTRHIDPHKEGTEWGVYFTLTDFSAAGLAAIGGIVAATLGFEILFYIIALLQIIGALLLIPIRPYLKKR